MKTHRRTLWTGILLAASLALAAPAFAAPKHPKTAQSQPVQSQPAQSQVERGHEVYQKWCYPCHGPGSDKPGTASLQQRGQKPAVLADRTDLTAQVIKTFVRHGVYYMPIFRKTEVSDADLDAIAAYLTRNNKP
jgi:mono/diheme cytochrome c family protein